jgi:CelD/BcsL family acetyltransferase involved in cellulose biosynthesis
MKLLDIAVLEKTRDFAALEEEWGDLYRSCSAATPFQSWAWLYSWWEFYGEGYELRLITLRDGDLLVGIMPLMLERRGGFGRLLFIGTGSTDYLDVLAKKGWEAQVAEAGRRALRGMNSWHVADLQELHSEAAAWSLFHAWDGFRIGIWLSNRLLIDVKPWDELLMCVHQKLRSNTRRTIRRAKKDGVRCELVGVDGVEQAARNLVALNREQWRGRWRETAPEHWSRRFEAYLEVAICRMTARELGGISEFRRDGEVLISHFLVFSGDFVGKYMIGAGQKAFQRYQFSSLGIWDAMNIAYSRSCSYLDLGRGEESYKLRWSTSMISIHRIILGRSWISYSPYAGYQVLRSKAKRYLYSESAPKWVKDAKNRSQILRYAFAPYGAYHLLRSKVTEYAKAEDAPTWIKSAIDRLNGFLAK